MSFSNMAKHSKSFLISFLNIAFLIVMTSRAQAVSRDNICEATRFPSYCSSVLPNNDTDIHDFGRFSLRKSLSQSQNFLNSVNTYLQRKSDTLSQPTIRALLDCRELLSANIDLLANAVGTLNKTSKLLPSLEADDLQTHLSTVVTNLETCSDGLEPSPSVKNDMAQPLSDDSKLHSVSLALCTQGWVPKQRDEASQRPRRHPVSLKGLLPLNMSDRNRALYDWARNHHRGRKLLQVGDEYILVRDIVIVSQDGTWNCTTINDAIAAAPNNSAASGGYFLIYVTADVYEEYISIASNKKYLFLLGDGINQTIITGNHSVGDGWTTFDSATLIVTGQGFLAVGITVRNSAGPSKGQAVALRSGADLSTFYQCSFEAYQDTLYTHSQRQFYRECDVYGTVDFIFGNAAVVLQNCNIYPRLPIKGQFNVITAQARTDPNQSTGTSVQNCTIRPTPDLATNTNFTTNTYLGRPWKEYSRTVFMQSFMGKFIDPAGWQVWSGDFALSTLYYAEYANTGPGSNTTSRVTWPGYHIIGATEAANFTVSTFLLGDNWLPQTGVPYTGGLMW